MRICRAAAGAKGSLDAAWGSTPRSGALAATPVVGELHERMQRIARAFLVLLLTALGAAAAHSISSASAPGSAADAGAVAAVNPPTQSGSALRLGLVGDVTVASYPPRGFDRLTPAARVLAYELAQAALAGDSLFTRQTSRFALPAQQLVHSILAKSERLEPALREKLRAHRRSLFLHHGLHDVWRSRKVAPPLERAEFERAARAAGVTAPDEL